MKSLLALLFVLISSPCFAQQVEKCQENPDILYNRQNVLEEIAGILNEAIPEYGKMYSGFRVRDERAILFFVHDLTDPSNKQTGSKDKQCVNFINNHIYHVSPLSYMYSFSQIVVLEGGKLRVFKSINCLVDKPEDVIRYLSAKLAGDKNKDAIIERVKNYRKYGRYYRVCADEYHKCQDDDFNEININSWIQNDSDSHSLLFSKYSFV